jgi:hypothetical protein
MRGDAGEAEVDARRLHRRLRGLHAGFGLNQCGLCFFMLLAAHRVGLDQFAEARGLAAQARDAGLRGGERGPCLLVRGLERTGFDLVQHLARTDHAAFLEQTLAHDAVDLRAHFGHPERGRTARQFGAHRHVGRVQRHHADFGRRSLGGGRLLGAACGEHDHGKQREGKQELGGHGR